MSILTPLPHNELERLISLSEFDLDYTSLQNEFQSLIKLAAKIAGTEVSLLNLVDTYTQWTISCHGIIREQLPREDSVCAYTIDGREQFEVKDLSKDSRFNEKSYVTGDPNFRYYFGVPLVTTEGYNIGALCVLDKREKIIDAEQAELLKMIAAEIVFKMRNRYVVESLKAKAKEARDTKLKVAHDIRGPLSGIIGLAEIVKEQGPANEIGEVLKFIDLIHESGTSILDLADEIMSEEKKLKASPGELQYNQINLGVLKEKLEKLYVPQAKIKDIALTIDIGTQDTSIRVFKNKLLQIAGNLISNAIKFTQVNGTVMVTINVAGSGKNRILHMEISDNGSGLNEQTMESILNNEMSSTDGTNGEQGYGFGLYLVKHLVDSLKGTLKMKSVPGNGATFLVSLPQLQS